MKTSGLYAVFLALLSLIHSSPALQLMGIQRSCVTGQTSPSSALRWHLRAFLYRDVEQAPESCPEDNDLRLGIS